MDMTKKAARYQRLHKQLTVLLGKSATREQRDRFTRVLKGHIALASARFPAGIAGVMD